MACGKSVAKHAHQLCLHFLKTVGSFRSNLLLQSRDKMGLAIVGGGDRIRAEAILLKKIGKPEPDRIQLAVNCSIKIAIGTGRAYSLLLNDFPREKK